MITEPLLLRAESGDLEALAELDAQGLLIGPDESTADYGRRLRSLLANIARIDSGLEETGSYQVEDIAVERSQRIPPEILAEPQELTDSLFGFRIDWVPGFFINPHGLLGKLLFGGCAYFFYPDFFALFIIRRAFATRDRWLIYRRRELLAHELCHVARLSLGSIEFEETFAYRTASSRFRLLLGSVFRSPLDSYAFLGSAFAVVAGRLLQVLRFPRLAQWPFWLPLVASLLFYGVRHTRSMRRLARAREALVPVFGSRAEAVLFRCTDAEIGQIAERKDSGEIRSWIDRQGRDSWRWRVAIHRFSAPPADAAAE